MLSLLSQDDARRFRELFFDAGYTEDSVRKHLATPELPSHRLKNTARLLDRTSEPSRLSSLLRLFWIGASQPTDSVAPFLPDWFITLAIDCGLLKLQSNQLLPTVMVLPADGLLIASDHTSKMEEKDPEFVLWPNPTTRLLSRFTVRRPSGKTLDLGTGTGMLALTAAAHSEKVIATDINPRAVEFAAFNARLNGVENVQCVLGDGFTPVAESTFDLIFSNPPFFITPSDRFLFCDNPMELDGLCRALVRQAPAHLNDGGYFQMLCEWAEVDGQPWQERLTEWFKDIGCDVWVLKGISQDPSEYAQERARETASPTDNLSDVYSGFMSYYREKCVTAIHDGLVVMQRRAGKNWILLEDITHTPREPFGHSVVETFAARKLLISLERNDDLLDLRLRLSPAAQLEQLYQMAVGGWESTSLTLRLTNGIPSSMKIQPLVADFLRSCDGTVPVRELVANLSAKVDVPPEQVKNECLQVVRTLIERRYLLA